MVNFSPFRLKYYVFRIEYHDSPVNGTCHITLRTLRVPDLGWTPVQPFSQRPQRLGPHHLDPPEGASLSPVTAPGTAAQHPGVQGRTPADDVLAEQRAVPVQKIF